MTEPVSIRRSVETDLLEGSAFRQFVLKIHSRCDLACDHCYVYTMADQRWRARPIVMTRSVVEQTTYRIAEHVRAHSPTSIDVVLHGGEPLLAGPARIAHCVAGIRAAVGTVAAVDFTLQTNGVLLDADYHRLFRRLGIRVSVSLDGDRVAQDRHRRRRDGRGSHADVVRALRDLSSGRFRSLFSGLLCTIDLRNDPVTTYESLLEFRPPAVDFLLPHGNWLRPPPMRDHGSSETPYAEWLIAVFDRWYGATPQETRVRKFDEIIHVALGGRSGVEGIGVNQPATIVVETDGAIERSDMLTAAYEGAGSTGLHVADDSFDAALTRFVPQRRADVCADCDLYRICGGGLYAHRFGPERDFDNESVYCPDLYRLISHIRSRLIHDVAALRSSAP
ncbi:MAG: FxsB family cyclophane-forming radical SAM/SPASM peptide maturase [Pseudonocardiaceae bacterium]